jgi:hypothetical protein
MVLNPSLEQRIYSLFTIAKTKARKRTEKLNYFGKFCEKLAKSTNFDRKVLNINKQIYFLSLGIAAAIAPTRDLVCVGKMVIFFLTTGTA